MASPAYKVQKGPRVVSSGTVSNPKALPTPRPVNDPAQSFRRVTNPVTIV